MSLEPMPGPPAALASRKISLIEFNEALFRSHQIKRNPIHYGKSHLYRFDASDGSYGVLCVFANSALISAYPRFRV